MPRTLSGSADRIQELVNDPSFQTAIVNSVSVSAINSSIGSLQTSVNALQTAPAKLQDDINTTQAQETQYDALIQAKRKEQDLVRKTAEEDLQRYKEMQARTQAAAP